MIATQRERTETSGEQSSGSRFDLAARLTCGWELEVAGVIQARLRREIVPLLRPAVPMR